MSAQRVLRTVCTVGLILGFKTHLLIYSVHRRGPFRYFQPAPITGCIIMRGITLDIQHLHAIAYVTPRPPPALVHYPRIEIATCAHHSHLFYYIRLSSPHVTKHAQHDGYAAAEAAHGSLLDPPGRGICLCESTQHARVRYAR